MTSRSVEIILADDDFAEFVKQRMRERAGFLDRFVDGVDSCIHCKCYSRWTQKQGFLFKRNFLN